MPVKIDPQYVPFTLEASFIPTGNTAKFTAEIDDEDQERWQRASYLRLGLGRRHDTRRRRSAEAHVHEAGLVPWKVTVSIRSSGADVTARSPGRSTSLAAGIKLLRVKQSR